MVAPRASPMASPRNLGVFHLNPTAMIHLLGSLVALGGGARRDPGRPLGRPQDLRSPEEFVDPSIARRVRHRPLRHRLDRGGG
jgi:hypothetical protein